MKGKISEFKLVSLRSFVTETPNLHQFVLSNNSKVDILCDVIKQVNKF